MARLPDPDSPEFSAAYEDLLRQRSERFDAASESRRLEALAKTKRKADSQIAKRFVYFIAATSGHIKIGVATRPKARLRNLQIGYPEYLELVAVTEGDEELEREYHHRFAAHHRRGEWFNPHSEIWAEITRIRLKNES